MATTSLPASEDTTADKKNFLMEEGRATIAIVAPAGGLSAGDAFIYGPWFGIVDADIAATEEGTMDVVRGKLVRSANILAGATFTEIGQEVWYDNTTGAYYDGEEVGAYLVGYVTEPTGIWESVAGVFGFEKRRYIIAGEAT